MRRIVNIKRKLRGRSADELRTRGVQALNAVAERNGWSSLTRVPDDTSFFKLIDNGQLPNGKVSVDLLLTHFRNRSRPRFFPSFSQKHELRNALRERFCSPRLLDRAKRAAVGRFDLLGIHDLHFGMPINWHLEPISNVVVPNKHWSQIAFLEAAEAGDKKIIWELNRHAYFTTLGRAYWKTEDEFYAQIFVDHINSWIDANPPKLGINWASSLEVAFRAISWLWALHFFRDSSHLTSQLFLRLLKFLYLHGRHLETYLSTYFSPNTHLTGEALGLFYLGTMLPELKCGSRWRNLGLNILLSQLDQQVRSDGVYFEQSSYYHRYTTDFYTHLLILLRENTSDIPPQLEVKLKLLLDHLMLITRPDGTTPLIGDDDGGRLVFLDDHAPDDFRSALSNGAALFHRSDYKYVASAVSEETMWLMGCDGLRSFDGLHATAPTRESVDFSSGGYYVMRDGWSIDANYMLMDCGPHGGLRHGHAHADVLSFDLAARGRTMLVDPGTFTYTGSAAWRDRFRSSAVHNSLTVDGESSSVSDGPFSWKQVAEPTKVEWLSRSRFDYFVGKHSGFERLPSPVVHQRTILFLKADYWIMVDRIDAVGAHSYSLNFQYAAGLKPEISGQDEQAVVRTESDAGALDLCILGNSGQWRVQQSWVSRCYGEREEASLLTFEFKGDGALQLITLLVPQENRDQKVQARTSKCQAGAAMEIANGENHDLLLLGLSGQSIKRANIQSDFELAWVRVDRETLNLKELVAINGSNLSFAGQEIVGASQFIKYLEAKRSRDGLRGEAEGVGNWHTPFVDVRDQMLS